MAHLRRPFVGTLVPRCSTGKPGGLRGGHGKPRKARGARWKVTRWMDDAQRQEPLLHYYYSVFSRQEGVTSNIPQNQLKAQQSMSSSSSHAFNYDHSAHLVFYEGHSASHGRAPLAKETLPKIIISGDVWEASTKRGDRNATHYRSHLISDHFFCNANTGNGTPFQGQQGLRLEGIGDHIPLIKVMT